MNSRIQELIGIIQKNSLQLENIMALMETVYADDLPKRGRTHFPNFSAASDRSSINQPQAAADQPNFPTSQLSDQLTINYSTANQQATPGNAEDHLRARFSDYSPALPAHG